MRKDQNTFSVEDVKKDFVKVQEQSNYLEEKLVALQKLTDSTGIESKNKCRFKLRLKIAGHLKCHKQHFFEKCATLHFYSTSSKIF